MNRYLVYVVISIMISTTCGCSAQSEDTSRRAQSMSALESIRKSCDSPYVAKELNVYFIPAYDSAIAHLASMTDKELREPFLFSASWGEYENGTNFFRIGWLESNISSVVRELIFLDARQVEIGNPLPLESKDSDYFKTWTVKAEINEPASFPNDEEVVMKDELMLVSECLFENVQYVQFVYLDETTGERKKSAPAKFFNAARVLSGSDRNEKGSASKDETGEETPTGPVSSEE